MGSFKSSESRLDGLEVLEVGHDVVPQEAQDGLLSVVIEIGCDGPMPLEEKDLWFASGDEPIGDSGGLFDLRNRRRARHEDEDHEPAEANVGGGGKCLLKLRNSGIGTGEEG